MTSQTLVGFAEGDRSVNVTMDLELTLDVNDELVVTERTWSAEGDPIVIPEPKPDEEEEEEKEEVKEEEKEEEEAEPEPENKVTIRKPKTETIVDEEVPLAEAPKTGDFTYVLIVAIAVLAVLAATVIVLDKKRRNEKN